MHLYIMRHGEAEQYAQADSQRNLNQIGRVEAFDAGKKLRDQLSQLDVAWVSQFNRAQQTYDEVAKSVNCLNLKYSDKIIPSSRPLDVQHSLDKWLLEEGIQSLLIVSHMPLVGYLVSQLCGNADALLFPTAAIAEIDYDPILSLGTLVRFSAPD